VVVSDIFGVSGRQMLAALIGGQRDPQALAQLARGVMRRKITTLQEAFTGYFTSHHAFLLATMLARGSRAAEQDQPAAEPDEDQVEQARGHGRSSCTRLNLEASLQLTGEADFWHPAGELDGERYLPHRGRPDRREHGGRGHSGPAAPAGRRRGSHAGHPGVIGDHLQDRRCAAATGH
jgi:hypothetical protein